jgi:small redox-active disulfide protein 2
MPHIKVLGSGCANCQTTQKLIESVLAEQHITATVEKVEDLKDIMRYGVMSTPAVVIDEVVVHSGSVPKREAITAWLSAPANAPGCASDSADQAKTDSSCCSGNPSCCE